MIPETLLCGDRIKNLMKYVTYAKQLAGNIIEFGVYKGGSLLSIVNSAGQDKKIYAIDTFYGIPEKTPIIDNYHLVSDFKDSDHAGLCEYFKPMKNVNIMKGFFPKDFPSFESGAISLAHIDVDMYVSTREALNYVHDRIIIGGIILCDDYAAGTTAGARKAVHEFLGAHSDKYKIHCIVNEQITLERRNETQYIR